MYEMNIKGCKFFWLNVNKFWCTVMWCRNCKKNQPSARTWHPQTYHGRRVGVGVSRCPYVPPCCWARAPTAVSRRAAGRLSRHMGMDKVAVFSHLLASSHSAGCFGFIERSLDLWIWLVVVLFWKCVTPSLLWRKSFNADADLTTEKLEVARAAKSAYSAAVTVLMGRFWNEWSKLKGRIQSHWRQSGWISCHRFFRAPATFQSWPDCGLCPWAATQSDPGS